MSGVSNESSGQLPVQPNPELVVPDAANNVAKKEGDPFAHEQANAVAEKAHMVSQVPAMPLPPMILPGTQMPTHTAQQTDVTITSPSASSGIIDDSDLIEKEWVNKAKRIVEANREDPFKQSEELTGVKADYMKKRYDKNIKLK